MNDRHSEKLARRVHRVLLTGVILSAIFLAVGIPKTILDRKSTPGNVPPPPPTIAALVQGAVAGNGEALLRVGLLILMATPIARVLVLALSWGLQKDFRLMAIAVSVLLLLALSITLSIRG